MKSVTRSVLVVIVALALPWASFAAAKTPAVKETVSLAKKYPLSFDVAAATAWFESVAMPGINLAINQRIVKSVPTFIGFEVSSYFHSTNSRGALIPLLLSSYVEFEVSPKIHPSLGLLVGPAFAVNNAGIEGSAHLAVLFRPGITFNLTEDVGLNFQSRFGVIGAGFAFIPQLGATVNL